MLPYSFSALFLDWAKSRLDVGDDSGAKIFIMSSGLIQQSRLMHIEDIFKVTLGDGKSDLDDEKFRTLTFYHRACEAVKSLDSMKQYLNDLDPVELENELRNAEPQILIVFSNTTDGSKEVVQVNPLIKLKTLVNTILVSVYSGEDDGRLVNHKAFAKTLRISFNGKRLFLSSYGKKRISELGIIQGSKIIVEEIQEQRTNTGALARTQPTKGSKPNKKRGNKKSRSKKKGRRKQTSYVLTPKEEDYRLEHSKCLSRVFEEADGIFKDIRQRLNSLVIKNPRPKSKVLTTKCVRTMPGEGALTSDGQAGKAGKVMHPILVGDVQSLYKSSKKTMRRHVETLVVDLHGFSVSEATGVLDNALPGWLDIAMRSHPFVVPVDIVCGAGNQILSETVELWIRKQMQVANRPKGFY
ncbi:hypothetical protein ACHAWF_016923 [Thalassiosira exigua]